VGVRISSSAHAPSGQSPEGFLPLVNLLEYFMKSLHIKILSAIILLVVSFSCGKSSNSNTNTCTVTTGDAIPLSVNKQVSYTASVTGGAIISTISFQDSAGTTIVNNPKLPFSIDVNLKTGSTASITASGSAGNGNITVTSNGANFNSASCN
jgi:hypothetical protein